MEVARKDCFLPSRQKIHLSDKVDDYLSLFKSNKAEGKNYIHEVLTSDWQPLPEVAYDCLPTLFSSKCHGF